MNRTRLLTETAEVVLAFQQDGVGAAVDRIFDVREDKLGDALAVTALAVFLISSDQEEAHELCEAIRDRAEKGPEHKGIHLDATKKPSAFKLGEEPAIPFELRHPGFPPRSSAAITRGALASILGLAGRAQTGEITDVSAVELIRDAAQRGLDDLRSAALVKLEDRLDA